MSELSVDRIKSRIGNAARPNRFSTYFFCPPLGISVDAILCKSATMPGKTFETTPFSTYGVVDTMPQQVAYDATATFSFMCDNSFAEKQVFESWFNFIYGSVSEGNDATYKPKFSYQNEYLGQLHVNHLRSDGSVSDASILHDAFPVAITAQQLDYDSTDVILQQEVQFAFRYYTTKYNDLPEPTVLESLLNTGRQVLDVAGDVASVIDRFGGDGSSLRETVRSAGTTIDSASSTLGRLGLP